MKAREEIAARVGMSWGVAGWSENLGGLAVDAIVCKGRKRDDLKCS